MARITALCLALFVTVGFADAGVKIGDAAPMFKGLKNATETGSKSLSDYKKDVVVVCITCNHCPFAIAIEDKLIGFEKKFGDKVDLVAINVNTSERDGLPKMKERAKEKGFNFDYLFDPSQKIAKDLGAKRTPEFFVFARKGGSLKLVYTGKMDNGGLKPAQADAGRTFLIDAVEAALAGKAPKTPKTPAKGCGIRFND